MALQVNLKNRIDIFIKLFFLKMQSIAPEEGRRLYVEHISLFNGGLFFEDGDLSKNSPTAFVQRFLEINRSIASSGFVEDISRVPVSKKGELLNGSHRISACLFNRVEPAIEVSKSGKPPFFNQQFYQDRLVSANDLEAALSETIEYFDGLRLVIIWPRGQEGYEEIERELNIVYEKKISISRTALTNLIPIVYRNEEWAVDKNTPGNGVQGKAQEVYEENGTVSFCLVQETTSSLIEKKAVLRSIIGSGKASLHSTDTNDDTRRLLQFALSPDLQPFLEYGDIRKLAEIQNKTRAAGYKDDEYILDGSSVLSIYGLRRANDLDLIDLGSSSKVFSRKKEDMSFHGHDIHALGMSKFCNNFNGMKVLSLNQIRLFKLNRGEKKDKEDILLIDRIKSENFRFSLRVLKIKVFYYLKFPIFVIKIWIKRRSFIYKLVKPIWDVFRK